MKNKTIPALLIALCLALVPFLAAFAEDGPVIRIQDAAYDQAAGVLTVQWSNTGSAKITGVELRINPRNPEGKALVIDEGLPEDILLEERVYHICKEFAPGETVIDRFLLGGNYPEADHLEIAVDRTDQEDGSFAPVPDDRLIWYSTLQKAYVSGPENSEPYTLPDAETLALSSDAPLGFTAIAVTGELAEAYGFAHSGMLVVEVREDSAADLAGLEAGDLIYGAGGALYRSEPYIVALAAAERAAGRQATLLVLREGEELEIPLQPAE